MRKINGKNYLSSYEVANLLDISPRTIQRWVHKNRQKRNPILKQVKWTKDPTNGRFLFEESSIIRTRSYFVSLTSRNLHHPSCHFD